MGRRSVVFFVLFLMPFFEVYAGNEGSPEGEYRIEFSANTRFPMDRRYCVGNRSPENCTLGGMKRNQIVLTFDDGPNVQTQRVLGVLNKWNVPATFFVHIGYHNYTRGTQSILNQIHRSGHKIANHGRSHSPLNGSTNSNTLISYLLETHEIIAPYQKRRDIPLYRNPGGYWNPGRASLLNSTPVLRDYVGPIFWNVGGSIVGGAQGYSDAADWQCQSRGISANACAQGYYNKIIRNYRNNEGSLVLMHDIHPVSAPTLDRLLQRLSQDSVNWDFIFVQDIPAVKHYFTEI